MEKLNIIYSLIDKKKLALINFFIANKERQLYLTELAKNTKVPIATTYRIIQNLVDLGVIKQIKISKFKVYQWELNEKTDLLESILREEKKIVDEFVRRTKGIPNVQRILMHGKESYSRVSIVIIGKDLDLEKIKLIAGELKQNYKFIISYLTLTEEQFQQMKTLGLFSRELRVLYDEAMQ